MVSNHSWLPTAGTEKLPYSLSVWNRPREANELHRVGNSTDCDQADRKPGTCVERVQNLINNSSVGFFWFSPAFDLTEAVYTYDSFDHLQTRTDPLSRQEAYVFDQLGNLTSFTDRRGKLATYLYDGINRRIFAGYGTLPGPTYESTISYTYDGGNRLTRVVDSTSGTISPVFDGLDRLISETTPQGSITYQYDNDSRLQTATVTGQPIVNYYFDNASRLYKVAQGSTTTLIGYDNANRRSSLALPNGIVLTYGYDNDSRIKSMIYQLGTTSVGDFSPTTA